MASSIVLSLVILFSLNSVFGDTCGGLLEGETGRFSFAGATNQEQAEASSLACLWLIQMHYENNLRFTLDALGEDAHLNLYSEDQLPYCSANDYTKLNPTNVGSSFEFLGKTLIVVLPNSSALVAFSWSFVGDDNKNSSVVEVAIKNSDYIISPSGLIEWEQLETEERVTWGIHANENFHIRWNVGVPTSCKKIDKCACFSFAIFQLTSDGALSEAVKTCGSSSEGKLKGISRHHILVLIMVNTKVEANTVAVSWEVDDIVPTERPVTQPPVPTTSGLFAATATGLIALDLQTFETTTLSSEAIATVSVNHKLNKVYWSNYAANSSIMRSNFDGSAKEVIVLQTGDYIESLAVEEASGNIYYTLYGSQGITVCNSSGLNCATVTYNSSLVNQPLGIALDSQNSFMYWSNRGSIPGSLASAKLDGSMPKIISTEFNHPYGITLDQSSNSVLYWVDGWENTIGTIDVNGGNKRTLVELKGNPRPLGIQVDAHKIYFSNFWGKTIQSVDRYSGKELTTIFNSTGEVRHLAIFNGPATHS